MLQEVAIPQAFLELVPGQEVVVHALGLPRSRLPGGGGDRQAQLREALHQRADERALPHSGGAGDDEDPRRRDAGGLAAEVRDELVALALGEPADGLARRNPALREDAIYLHAAVLGDR